MDRLLAGKSRPTGVLAYNDMVAFGAIDSIKAHGLKLGTDIGLVGHGNIEGNTKFIAQGHKAILTTFGVDLTGMCEAMADTLLAQIEKPTLPVQQKLFPSELIVRESARAEIR